MTWFIVHRHGGPAHLPKYLADCRYTERAWANGEVHRLWHWVDGPLTGDQRICQSCERILRRRMAVLERYMIAAGLTIN